MEEALEIARAKDTKERMAGVERLHQILEASRKALSSSETTSVVDCCLDLLKDNNFRVCQEALQVLASAAVLSGEHLKLHLNALLPAVVERLGDGKQPVRDAARRLLITLMEVSSATIIVERAGNYAWSHKSWRIREEFARTMASAIGIFAATELPLQRVVFPSIALLLDDPNQSVREASFLCIKEMYLLLGPQFRDELQRHHLPSSLVKEINAKLEKIELRAHTSTANSGHHVAMEPKHVALPSSVHKKNSPRSSALSRDVSISGGDGDVAEKPVDPIRVYSEKELIKEIEKIAATLVPEKDWSIRIGAMQRVEGLVFGGAIDYPSFSTLLKQLVTPLSSQLSDRRSSVVKQACHLLSLLSKELLGDFEACAEMFIPVLLKLVVITVLVIAESADNCIKTMLRNCKVARVLPRITDSAKNDRSAVLRARCCEYALLILEYWADSPEIQRSADLYEDLIKCCVGDAMSEVRSIARTCYRMFEKTWLERSKRLFLSFDPVIQRMISEEDGGIQKRYASPSLRERGGPISRIPSYPASSNIHVHGTSAIIAMDRHAAMTSRPPFSSSSLFSSQAKSEGKGTERTLESVLQSSKQKVTAIESLLGLKIPEKTDSSGTYFASLDLGVDHMSAHNLPSGVPALENLTLQGQLISRSGQHIGARSGDLSKEAYRKFAKESHISEQNVEPSIVASQMVRVYPGRLHDGDSIDGNTEIRTIRRLPTMNMDKQYIDTPYKDTSYRGLDSYIPNFQRPLLRKNVTGRNAISRNCFEDNQYFASEIPNHMESHVSLSDALVEGLSSTSDWSVRVSAFNHLRTLLQQGSKGTQEVIQNFEKVMKLFFQHLDDPHHKVAQAALLTLSDLIPACRKPFEGYLERILPHVFSRLIDPKELVRQPSATTLEIVSKTYGIDSLLSALLRSLDEQRSPKAKLAVIEFAVNSFNKHAVSSEGVANYGLLKLWLSKLTPLIHGKNSKLREAAIACFISIYTHFDSSSVLNFLLSLSVEEQNSLRRAFKQKTPRIEVDLLNFLQNKKERQRLRSYEQSDAGGTSSEEGYMGSSKKHQLHARHSVGSIENDGGKKWNTLHRSSQSSGFTCQAISDGALENLYQSIDDDSAAEVNSYESKELKDRNEDPLVSEHSNAYNHADHDNFSSLSFAEATSENTSNGSKHVGEGFLNPDTRPGMLLPISTTSVEPGPSIPQLLHQICSNDDEAATARKLTAINELIKVSVANDGSVWLKYFNQILTAVLEVLDDPDPSSKELALSLILEMLNNQKDSMEDSVEIVIEKLLNVTKDMAVKVSNEADHCLSIVLTQYDPYRCLAVLVPLLASEDEKTLVTCINSVTKLIGRFSHEELVIQLPSFLPAVFDAFHNQSADVRKTVVYCLVDIYILLGKTFLPYLEGLSSSQLRLVTLYANRISQARSGAAID